MEKMRDTDADWVKISSTEPFHGILAAEKFLTQNLTDEAKNDFFISGEQDIASIVSYIESLLRTKFSPAIAIDFGCGIGRLAFPMKAYADYVIGVDISYHMLSLAEGRRKALGITGIDFRQTLPEKETADWVNSYFVFQHIPPARGYGLLSQVLGTLRSGGVASIHLTAYRNTSHLNYPETEDIGLLRFDGEKLDVLQAAEDMPAGRMRMYDFDLGYVLPIFVRAGIELVQLRHVDHSGHHAFWFIGQKI